MSDIGFAMNYTNLYEINITPGGETKTWARIGAGINSAEWSGNEEVSQDPYYDGAGLASSDVTGGQMIGTFEGHRRFGDLAQDFISGLLLRYGEDRKTDFRWTQPNGDKLEGQVTIANIAPQSGDPNAKSDFGFEVHFNGMPTFTPGNANEMPETITADSSPLTIEVGATQKITANVTPDTAAPAVVYAVDDHTIATVDSDGTVHGVKAGETEISVKSCVRPSVGAVVKVTVSEASEMKLRQKTNN